MTKLAYLVSRMEGFGIPGSRPARDHNPGDLRAAPHATAKDAAGIALEPNDADGWADLERQLRLDASRGMTLETFVYSYAPPAENDSQRYLNFLAQGLGLHPATPLSQCLQEIEPC